MSAEGRGVPLDELGEMPALRWVKFVKAKGKAYAYFTMGRNEGGEPILVPLPRIGTEQFVEVYCELLQGRPQEISKFDVEDTIERARVSVSEALAASRAPLIVYFIQSDGGAVKIGVAKNPEVRLARLQVGTPSELRIVATTKGGFRQEREYHERFAEYRLRGEWFKLAPAIQKEIECLGTKEA